MAESTSTNGLTSVSYLDDFFITEISNPLITIVELFLGKVLNVDKSHPIRRPQYRMNISIKDIIK